ncbi:MAG TPA: hypothetical protein VFP13_02035, partial [Actinomycetota bacterium]|nr:hypothetical protein [Actinomycetota bacterium]
MADLKTLVEREMDRAGEPAFAFEDLDGLRVRRHRTNRITAAAVGLGLVLILALVGTSIYRSASIPATPPEEPKVDLGIFAPVAGKIIYYEDSGLWAVDPNAPSPASTLVRLDVGGTAAAARFASFTLPLGWSRDGTELLFLREDPTDDTFPYDRHLYILHADGTETQVTPEPVDGAAISPDGARVVFASVNDDGLYVVDAEGGQPVRIAEGEEPTFSPDGTQIAYLGLPRSDCCVPSEREHVWVANVDGTDAHEILVDEPALDKGVFGLQWSPSGDYIAMANSLERRVAIYTFAPDGSDFTKVIDGGMNPFWSPDGSEIAYGGLSIADADGSNVRTIAVGNSGPWHPGAGGVEGEDVVDPTGNRFVGGWTTIDYDDPFLGDDTTPYQTMTISAGDDGVLHITVNDDSACVPDATAQTMTGTGRLEDSTTLVVPSPDLTCVEGSVEASDRVEVLDDYTLVLDPDTDRLYDSLGVVWNREARAENRTGASTEAGVEGSGTYSILYREVAFRASEPWNDHLEAYIDPRTFFLIGPGDAEMT